MKYYPQSRVITGSYTNGGEYSVNGEPYIGPYYKTYDNKIFPGHDPVTGGSEPLSSVKDVAQTGEVGLGISFGNVATTPLVNEYNANRDVNLLTLQQFLPIVPYYVQPTDVDYARSYLYRYFAKKRNQDGGIIETTKDVYLSLQRTSSPYNYQTYHAIDIYWQLTGPLNDTLNRTVRIAGIINTNEKVVTQANKNFRGLTDYIGGNYTKFAKPTE
jgi:hypothetical protein